jgi:phosphatidate cytidylyltransferase
MLKTRILTACGLLAGLLAALFLLPQEGWMVFCALIGAGGAWEWGGLAGWRVHTRSVYAVVIGAICLVLAILTSASNESGLFGELVRLAFSAEQSERAMERVWLYGTLYTLAVLFWLMVVPFWLKFKWRLQAWSAPLTGFIVLVPPALAFVQLRAISPLALLALAALVWVADTAAYFAGRAFGRKKLAPNISPGKTWAGAVGAVLGVMIYCSVLLRAIAVSPVIECELTGPVPIEVGILLLQPIFIAIAVFSIVGDLFESLLKRLAGVKDSGRLLPGHGGILDRIDSLTATMPVFGMLMVLVAAVLLTVQ